MFLSVINELPSTQQYLSNLAQHHDLPEWTICRVLHQSKGKGMGTNSWESEKEKNLLFSLFLRPEFLQPHEAFCLSKIVALGIRKTLQEFVSEPVHIKWPNDIYIGNKKVCGMLVENTFTDVCIKTSLIGIGININQAAFSPNLPNPASLVHFTNKELCIEQVLRKSIAQIKHYYQQVIHNGAESINENYLSRLYQINQWQSYQTDMGTFRGRIIGVDAYGFLQIEDQQGKIRSYDVKQVSYL
jgi:BirA family biotin operon repressor/biotin-[acetyl-CoA-carboxylase] ligase